jgi:streptogramin lyase
VIKLRLIAMAIALASVSGCKSGGGTTTAHKTKPPPPPAVAAKIKTFKLGGDLWAVLATKNVVWALDHDNARVLRVAPSGRRIGRPVRLARDLGTSATALSFAGGDVWLGYTRNYGFVARLDPATGAHGTPVRVGPSVQKLAVTGGSAYVSYLPTGIARVPLAGGRPRTVERRRTANALLFVRGELWATVWNGLSGTHGSILELNGRTLANENDFDATDSSELTTSADEAQPFGMAAGAGSIWVAVVADVGELVRIDLKKRNETARVHLGTSYPFAVAFLKGSVWVLDYYANTLTRVDPRTNRVTGRLRVGPPRNPDNIPARVPAGLSAYGSDLWVTDEDSGTLTRVTVP